MIVLARFLSLFAIIMIFTTLDMWFSIVGLMPFKPTVLTGFLLLIASLILYFFSNETKINLFYTLKESKLFYFLFYLFSIYSLVTVLFTDIGINNLIESFLFFYALIIILLSKTLISYDANLIRKYIGVALTILCLSVFVDVFNPGYFGNYEQRASGFPQNPTRAAIAVNFALIGAINYDRFSRLDIFYFLISGFALLSIMSKTGIFIFAATSVLYIYHHRFSFSNFIKSSIYFGIFLFVFAQIFLNFLYVNSIFSLPGAKIDRILSLESLIDFSVRYELWINYLSIANENLIFGKGAGYISSLDQMGTHNFFLHLVIEYGLVGLFLILIIFIFSGFYCFRVGGQVLSIYFAILILSFVFSTPLYERTILFMLAFGMISAYHQKHNLIQKKYVYQET